MNYDTMPAGAELDRLIAEKVMGWKCTSDGFATAIEGTKRYIVTHEMGLGDLEDLAFRPSKNITDAWEVVEECERHGLMPEIGSMGGAWECKMLPMQEHDWREVFRTIAETAPLVICRAALNAVAPHDPIARGLAEWEARPPGPDGTKPC